MTATAPPKKASAKRDTWEDWLPEGAPAPDRFLTRDELVDRLRHYGIDVDARDLRFWENSGVLPRPVKRRHNGATWALYPDWGVSPNAYLYLIRRLRQLQAAGQSLQQIAPRIRRSAEIVLNASGEDVSAARSALAPFSQYANGPEDLDPPDTAISLLVAFGRTVEAVGGVPNDRLEIVYVSTDGGETRYTVPLQPEPLPDVTSR